MQDTPWTADRVEHLKRLVGANLSANQIAIEIGAGVSRNAVIGRLKRMGLSLSKPHGGQAGEPRPIRDRAPARRILAAKADAFRDPSLIRPAAERPAEVAGEGSVKFGGLLPHHCRWPFGDPRSPDFSYCGAHRVEGKPYCAAHALAGIDPNRRV